MTVEMTGPVIPADLAALTLREQWNLHYDLIYRPHLTTWPAGAKLTVSYPSGRPGKPDSAGKEGHTPHDSAHVDLDDPGAIWKRLQQFQAKPTRSNMPGGNVWIGVAPRQPGLRVGQRGAGSECYGLPALWIDLDVDGGQHKRTDLPTREVADAMIAQCPYPPSLILATGGGLHLYWALAELLDQGHAPAGGLAVALTDEQRADKDLILRHKGWWLDRAAELGVYVDQAPIASTPHPLRAAGSINGKYGTPVTIIFADPERRYSRAELDSSLPPLPEKTVKARETREERAREVREAIDSGHARPGDRLAAEVPVSDVLLALGMTQAGANGWSSPDGGPDHPVHARVYSDPDGPEMVTAFDRSLQRAWGLEDDRHSLDSFTLLGRVLCGGDWGLAGRIAGQHHDDWPGLLELISDQPDPSELAERYPPPSTDVAGKPASGPTGKVGVNLLGKGSKKFAPKGDPAPWKDVMHTRDGWTPVTLTQRGDLVFARLGQYPGVWRQHVEMELDVPSQKQVPVTHFTQVVDWVASRLAVTRFYRGAVEVGDPEWTVCLYTADGKTRQIPELDARTSLDISQLRSGSSAPISIPADRVACALLADVLAKLGHEDIVERRRYLAAGWITDEAGQAVMAAPDGGVGASGIRTDLDVKVPGDDSTVATVGWREVSSTDAERRAGIEALVALTGLVPTRPEVGVDLAGALFSAPLRLSRRSAHIVVGKKGSGKSLIASAAFSAMAGVGMDGSSFVIKLTQATPAGTVSKAAWCTDLCCFADNFKQRAGASAARVNNKATECLGVLADGSYDGVADTKATQTGGTRQVLPVQTTAVITGEVIPEDDSSSMERAVIIPVTKGEVDLTPGTGAVDRYRELHASGNSRRGYADYLQWLAGQVDSGGEITGGGFSGLRAWSDGTKRDYFRRYAAERAGETVACDATGWAAYRAYAAAHGMEDLLPSQPRLDGWLQQLVELTSGAHADTDPGPHLLDGLTGLILERRGHIAAHDGNEPSHAMQWGWTPSTTRGGQNDSITMRAGGSCLGWLSQDKQFVCVTRPGLRAAARHARLPNLTASQFVECMAGYVVAGTRGDSEPSARLGITSRARSWILPTALFGVVADEEEPGVDTAPVDTGSVSSPRQGHWADGLDPTLEDLDLNGLDGLDHDPWDDRAQIG